MDCLFNFRAEYEIRARGCASVTLAPSMTPQTSLSLGQLPYDRGAIGPLVRAIVFLKPKRQPDGLSFQFPSGIRDSNSRPSAWEADALPTELIPPKSDPHRIQTCNLLIRSQMLYSVELGDQSSYSASASFLATLNLRSLILAFLPDRLRR